MAQNPTRLPAEHDVIDANGKMSRPWFNALNTSVATVTGAGITTLTGDVAAGPGAGSVAATLTTSGVTAGTYGDSTHVSQVTLDAKGRATSASNVPIAGSGSVPPLSWTLGIVDPVIPPTIASATWAWVNQGTATIAQVDSALAMHIVDNATLNWRVYVRGSLSGSYTIVSHRLMTAQYANSQDSGLYLYDGTKLEGIELLTQTAGAATVRVNKMANVTTDSGTLASLALGNFATIGSQFVLSSKIVEDTTNRTWFYSLDRGVNWKQLYQEATNTFLTPTKAGFGGVSVTSNAANYVDTTLLSWTGA